MSHLGKSVTASRSQIGDSAHDRHELETENNHLKNYLIALNEKLVVMNDLK